MLPASIEKALTEAERYFKDVSVALVSGEPVALVAASAALRQAAIDFSASLQSLSSADSQSKEVQSRLKALADGLSAQREGLIRRTVLVEQGLNAIVPATRDLTYAKAAGPYGNLGKQTGAFKFLTA